MQISHSLWHEVHVGLDVEHRFFRDEKDLFQSNTEIIRTQYKGVNYTELGTYVVCSKQYFGKSIFLAGAKPGIPAIPGGLWSWFLSFTPLFVENKFHSKIMLSDAQLTDLFSITCNCSQDDYRNSVVTVHISVDDLKMAAKYGRTLFSETIDFQGLFPITDWKNHHNDLLPKETKSDSLKQSETNFW